MYGMLNSCNRAWSRALLTKAYSAPRTPRLRRMSQKRPTRASTSAPKKAGSLQPNAPIVRTSATRGDLLRGAVLLARPRRRRGGSEERALSVGDRLHDRLVGSFHAPLVDVRHGDAHPHELRRHELRAVTLLRLPLAAHEDDPMPALPSGLEGGEPVLEGRP